MLEAPPLHTTVDMPRRQRFKPSRKPKPPEIDRNAPPPPRPDTEPNPFDLEPTLPGTRTADAFRDDVD
jgi:hypothetical protein